MITLKQISVKNRTYYFSSDMINIKNFDLSLLNIDKTSFKKVLMLLSTALNISQ